MSRTTHYPPPLFGARMNRLMEDKRISTPKMCELIGVERKSVYKYIHGETAPDICTFSKICRVLGADPNYLLGITDEFGMKRDLSFEEMMKEIQLSNEICEGRRRRNCNKEEHLDITA